MIVNLKKFVILYFASMLPWIEQKAGIVLIAEGEELWSVMLTTIFGAVTIVPIVILITDYIFEKLKKIKKLKIYIDKFEEKVLSSSDQIKKYETLGLFVIVVFPGTGMWTAAMLASLLKLDFWKSTFLIILASACVGFFYFASAAGIFEMFDFLIKEFI